VTVLYVPYSPRVSETLRLCPTPAQGRLRSGTSVSNPVMSVSSTLILCQPISACQLMKHMSTYEITTYETACRLMSRRGAEAAGRLLGLLARRGGRRGGVSDTAMSVSSTLTLCQPTSACQLMKYVGKLTACQLMKQVRHRSGRTTRMVPRSTRRGPRRRTARRTDWPPTAATRPSSHGLISSQICVHL